MPRPAEDKLPFVLSGGWPDAVPGSVVTLRETGIVLGTLPLDDAEWRMLQSQRVFSLRVDEHPATDGWMTTHSDGTETRRVFGIPLAPVVVPSEALADGRDFSDWVWHVHGALGRLLVWDESRNWWIVQETDLELMLISAPRQMFGEKSDVLSWWDIGTVKGRRAVDALGARYHVEWDE
ncbi:hypothetical protein ORV05_03165 [Amycolatopsis cynarae]|uniref:Uncharacterized protein n=1 Tax=Amycolatopsis cynarae TaxID=2995223 RepID=A0ABY7B7H8_9PSEU|nr:hypothetical protein [Amycolatopsis sp. HUAS 11-8]WAL66826.1 hypothetical protein ORV05_03165 [Amycolatopsis sp. HUAS 11-8]